MSAFATLLTPVDASPAIELGNTWRKRILPVGEIEYQGRQLKFTRSYLQGLLAAFKDRAYDQVPLQFADSANSHTLDPERTRGQIVNMELADDGLYVTAELTPRGQRTLQENPYLGCSARIVEQFQRSDGKFYPAAVQHVLGTLDPRIPGLGAWQEVQLANESSVVIDLSNLSFAQADTGSSTDDTLTDAELADLISAISEADAEGYADPGDELSDAELEHLMQAAESDERGQRDSFNEFDAAFSARQQASQDRADARAAAQVEDLMHPARRDEDRMARIMARAGQGVYADQQLSFTAESSAVELAMATGRGLCSSPDEFGRCGARWHALDCVHGQGTDWMATEGGPPRSSYDAAFSNFASGLNIDLAPRQVYDDPDDADLPPQFMPQQVVELASSLADQWGLHGDAWATPSYTDVLRAPGAPVTMQEALMAEMGIEMPQTERPQYPGVSELRARLGI